VLLNDVEEFEERHEYPTRHHHTTHTDHRAISGPFPMAHLAPLPVMQAVGV